MTKREAIEILRENQDQIRKEIRGQEISNKIKKLTSNLTEQELIQEIHKNRIFPDYLSLDEQLEEAYAIANSKKIMAKNEELKRTIKSKETISDDSVLNYEDTQLSDEPKLAPETISMLKETGYKWDGIKRLFVKESSTRISYYDPKTKITRRVAK